MTKLKNLTHALIITGVLGITGCATIDLKFKDSTKMDMKGTAYEEIVRTKADNLLKSDNYLDWRKAAQNYQSIGDEENMTKSVLKYFEKTGRGHIFKEFGLDNNGKEILK